jgi:hypothetical protein
VTSELPRTLEQAYAAVVGELGMVSAAWLFVREVATHAGAPGVEAFAAESGPNYPVIDAVARQWLEGRRAPVIDVQQVLAAIEGAKHVVVVGHESLHLDALVAAAPPELVLSLLAHRPFPVDWDRVLANHRGRVDLLHLDSFQSASGPKSALLGLAYGAHGDRTHVPPLWARAVGADVRAQFRALVGWDVLGSEMYVYPRWLTEVGLDEFTRFVGTPS